MQQLARVHRARLIVFKELNAADRTQFQGLGELGYIDGEVPPSHLLERGFISFDDYCAQLQSGYRRQVRASQRKFAKGKFQVSFLNGEQIAAAYTKQMHELYLAVWRRAKYRLEIFPGEFFRECARKFGARASMTVITKDDRPVAFAFGLTEGRIYHNLYVGIDYAMNNDADLYFNLYYLDINQAMRRGATTLHLGQTSDEFKARLGCRQEPLWFKVRATNRMLHRLLSLFARFVFPPVFRVGERNVFRADQFEANDSGCSDLIESVEAGR
jgi:predicted N-acyltransferase